METLLPGPLRERRRQEPGPEEGHRRVLQESHQDFHPGEDRAHGGHRQQRPLQADI